MIKLNCVIGLALIAMFSFCRTVTFVSPLSSEINNVIEFEIKINGIQVNNVFDQEQVRIDFIIQNSYKEYRVPCYWIDSVNTTSYWSCRFTPNIPDVYNAQVRVYLGNDSVLSDMHAFQVISSDKKGFLQVNDNYTLRFSNGELFRGVGTNFAWENVAFGDSKFTYDYIFPQYKQVGINFIRTWMCPWNIPLEWKKVRDNTAYIADSAYYNRTAIDSIDALFEKAKQNNIYIQLVADYYGALCVKPDNSGTNNFWGINNYNIANGGPCHTPQEFFTNEEAKKMYKNRLRYMIARWGSYPQFAALEFWGKVDYLFEDEGENWEDTMIVHISNWHQEMAKYFNSIDPYDRLLTASIASNEIAELFTIEELDYIQSHPYEQTDDFPVISDYFENKFNKPYVIGEFADSWLEASSDNNALKQGLWYGMFLPSPILPLSWWWDSYHAVGYDNVYFPVTEFNKLLLSGTTSLGTISTEANESKTFALENGTDIFVYAHNYKNNSVTEDNIKVSASIADTLYLYSFNTSTSELVFQGRVTESNNTFSIPVEEIEENGHAAFILRQYADDLVNRDITFFRNIMIFPNPASNTLTIENLNENQLIGLYNLQGKKVYEHKTDLNSKVELDISSFAPGLYIIHIIDKYTSYSSTIVKN